MMNLNRFMMGVTLMVFALTGCSNEEQVSLDGTADATTPLNISVSNAGLTKVGGVVSGSQFGDGASLGLFLTKEDGSAYDTDYSNIEYVSSNSGQTWTASSPILLTGTKANVYAYYPYDVANTNITAIPIDVTQNKDVMWADYASNINNANPTATLPMNHALSVIRFSLSKGDYSGAGSIESIKIKGDCMAKTGTLNAKNGTLTPTDAGAEIDLGATITLTGVAQTVEQLVIPTNTNGSIQVTIKMDGKTFEATSPAAITPAQSKTYKFGLAFTDSKLTMSTVTIGSIAEEDQGSMTTIVKTNPWAEFTSENDGVYGIDVDDKPLTYDEASSTASLKGVAIVMYGRALQISNSQRSNLLWGDHQVDISGITDVTQTGGGLTNPWGFLPRPDGFFDTTTESFKIFERYDKWPNYPNTALADTAGWSHTEALIEEQGSNYLGGVTTTFRNNAAANQGFTDWFIPAAGQLAYIHVNITKINTLIKKCGGTYLPLEYHWSSSESSVSCAWVVYIRSGEVAYRGSDRGKAEQYRVRFCRYLN